MSSDKEKTISFSEESQNILRKLVEENVFSEMLDGYRLAIAFAISRANVAPSDVKTNKTYLNIGSFDPDGLLRNIIIELCPEAKDQPYRYAERLAEWGIKEMGELFEAGALRFSDLFGMVHKPVDTLITK